MFASHFKRIWLPGFLLQSVMIAGGYGTGRELVEFFLSIGPLAGILAMLVATLAFSVIAVLCFELARLTASYTYRRFFHQLLGKGWFLYEIAYFVLCLLVLAVTGAAAGEIAASHLGLQSTTGTVILMALIMLLVFYGTGLIEKVLAGWSFLLYFAYALFVGSYLWRYGGDLPVKLIAEPLQSGWLANGIQYVGYNVAALPIILFCVKHMTSRRDALAAGALAGPLAMFPALLFFLAMVAAYPAINNATVPSDFMLQQLGLPVLKIFFYVVMFGTFVESGTAYLHAVNERVDELYRERKREMPRWLRPAIAFSGLLIAVVLADRMGLIDLIAKGYTTLTWVFILIFVIPLCTYGVVKIMGLPTPVKVRQSE